REPTAYRPARSALPRRGVAARSRQQLPAGLAQRVEASRARVAAVVRRDRDAQVARRQEPRRLVGPFDELQPRSREDVAKAGVLPFVGVVEAVEIAVRDLEAA